MLRPWLLRLALTAFLILCFARVVWMIFGAAPSVIPLWVEHVRGDHPYVVRALPGTPLPGPLVDGQIIDLAAMQAADRAALFNPGGVVPGTILHLAVRQGRAQLQAAVAVSKAPPGPVRSLFDPLAPGASVLLVSFVLAIGLLTLWLGRDGIAWGLCAFCAGVLLLNGLGSLRLPPLAAFWRLLAQGALAGLVVNPSVYVMADALAGAGLPPAGRLAGRIVVGGLALAGVALLVGAQTSRVLAGIGGRGPDMAEAAGDIVMLLGILVAVLVLVVGYRRAGHENRLRIRWVLWNTALLVGSGLLTYLLPDDRYPGVFYLWRLVLPGIAIAGYLYAILRTRIVDVAFVVGRALVYSVLTATVFGVFSLLEQGLHRLALGEQVGWVLQAVTVVALAAALSPLHRLLDAALERVFFHELRQIVGALRSFALEAPYFEKEEMLLARALAQLQGPCAEAAIYERSGAVYRLRQSGGEGWPEAVDADDPLFLKLRAGRQALAVGGLGSAVGGEGLAFPMTAGQALSGAVICRPRAGEKLDREVRTAIAELARAVGSALYMLRYREQARLIDEIAAGGIGPEAARTRAVALRVAV